MLGHSPVLLTCAVFSGELVWLTREAGVGVVQKRFTADLSLLPPQLAGRRVELLLSFLKGATRSQSQHTGSGSHT